MTRAHAFGRGVLAFFGGGRRPGPGANMGGGAGWARRWEALPLPVRSRPPSADGGGERRSGQDAKMGGAPGGREGGGAFARLFTFPGVGQRAVAGIQRRAPPHVSGFERCCFQLVNRTGGNACVTRGLHTECGPLTFSGGLFIQTKDRI